MIESGATVTAGSGDVVLRAVNTENDSAKAASKVSGGNVGVGASIALNVIAVNNTRAEIEDTAILTGGHNLILTADSSHSVFTTVKAGAAGGGRGKPCGSGGFYNDNTTARVGGSIEFDPDKKVDVADDTIDLGADYGLKTGDAWVYSSGGGSVIGGLENGKTYYIIKDSGTDHKVRLASSSANAAAGTAVNLLSKGIGKSHSLGLVGSRSWI